MNLFEIKLFSSQVHICNMWDRETLCGLVITYDFQIPEAGRPYSQCYTCSVRLDDILEPV